MGKKVTEVTTAFKVDISNLKKNIQDANRQIRLANSEFKEASAGMDDWSNNADGLSAKIKQLSTIIDNQETILKQYEEEYKRVAKAQGENSDAAIALKTTINNLKAAIKTNEAAVDKYEGRLEELENESEEVGEESKKSAKHIKAFGDEIEETEREANSLTDALKNLGSKAGGALKAGLVGLGTAAVSVATAFLSTAETSKEWIEQMNKLEASAKSAGRTTEAAKEQFNEFYGILGDEVAVTTTISNLNAIGLSEKNLASITNSMSGIWAKFGDSIPLDGLAESVNETAKVAQVTGNLADALNWAGISEDKFNNKLQKCKTAEQRQQLIVDTLAETYGKLGKSYKKINADIIESNKAQAKLNDAMAKVGKLSTPIITNFKNMGAAILNDLMPNIEKLGTGFNDMLNGTAGADKKIGDSIAGIIANLGGKITQVLPDILGIGANVITSLAQGIVNSLPTIIENGGKIITSLSQGMTTAMPGVIQTANKIITSIYNRVMNDVPVLLTSGAKILEKLGEGIKNNLPNFVSKALDAVNGFADMLTTNLPILVESGIQFVKNLATGLVNALPTFIEKAPEIISKFANLINDNLPKILKGAVDIVLTLAKGIISAIPTLVKNIPKIFTAILDVWEAFNWIGLGKKAITFLKDGLLSMIGVVKSAGKNILEAITNIIKDLPGKLFDFGKTGLSKFVKAITSGSETVREAGYNIYTKVIEVLENLPGNLKALGGKALVNFAAAILAGRDIVTAKAKGILDAVVNTIKALPNNLKELGKKALASFAAAILAGKAAVEAQVKGIFNVAVGAIKALPDRFKGIGGDIIKGLWNGIENMSEWVKSKIKGFSESVLNGIKEFFGIHSPSRVMRDEVGVNLAKGVIEGVEKEEANVKKSAESLSSVYVKAAKEKVKSLKESNKINLAQEIDYWKEIVKTTKNGTKAKEQAERQYLASKKTLLQEQKTIEADYNASVGEVNKKLVEDIQNIANAYDTQIKSRAESIKSQLGIFDVFSSTTENSKESLINNLKTQVDGLYAWDKALDELENRKGMDGSLIDEIQEMGVKTLADIQLLNSMTDEQLQHYINLWREKNRLAEERAVQENQNLQAESMKQIAELISKANSELNDLEKVYNENLKKIGVKAGDQSKDIGKNIVDGLKNGIVSQTGSFYTYLNTFFAGITSTAKNALDIHSPSRVFRDIIGKNIVLGISAGVEKNANTAMKSVSGLSNNLIKVAKNGLMGAESKIKTYNNAMQYCGATGGQVINNNYTFTQTNNSPKALSNAEIYRQTQNQFNQLKARGLGK